MPVSRAALLALLAAFATACVTMSGNRGTPVPGDLAGFYSGVLPCADCPGLRYELALRPDRLFMLQVTYLDRPDSEANPRRLAGAWTLSADRAMLVLRSNDETAMLFAVGGRGVLRLLDQEGRVIESSLNYELQRASPAVPFEPLVRLQGNFRYMADAGIFEECLTGARLPVAQLADNAALERAYLEAQPAPGQPVRVSVEARIGARLNMEDRLQDMLVVERFVAISPGAICGRPLADARLIGTSWRLTRLGARSVQAAGERRAPDLRLDPADGRAGGFGGCNSYSGTFRLDGQSLRIESIASTLMACPETMDLEAGFLHALERVSRWNILGDWLELYDEQGKLVARFQAD